ncbi:protein kinase domain containing protein [Babesia divergens]|uniref:Protein kinase domain containing protein n=1 Tax=Babesia divergens TaxID=32595 RepID=A0AAD9G834_BABDI|nr:protein kinase domain containing protein [Babesia divergens]
MHKGDEIVLYSDEKAIVVYNEGDEIRVLQQTTDSEVTSTEFCNQCPLCGNALDESQYTYITQTYFYFLQRNFKKWQSKHDSDQHVYASGSRCVDRGIFPAQVLPDVSTSLEGCDDDHNAERDVPVSTECYDKQNDSFDTGSISINSDIEGVKNIPPEFLITGYYNRFFEERYKLGSGSFGHVYYCVHIIDGLSLGDYAVKKLPVGDDRLWLRKMMREVKVRERLRHRNIVDYNHSWLEMHRLNEFCPYVPWLFVLMAYCNGGDLENFIRRFGGELDDEEILVLFLDIVNGLCHLHRHGIIYRDLKPSNVLLHLSQKDGVTALLSDFGTCEILAEFGDRNDARQGFTGTVEYTAPELLETDQFGEYTMYYDTKSDMWSLGIILYYLCYGEIPYIDVCPKKCREMILQHQVMELPTAPKRCTELKLLIMALTQRSPFRRPDCEAILSDRRMLKWVQDEDLINKGKAKIAVKLTALNDPVPTRCDVGNAIIQK